MKVWDYPGGGLKFGVVLEDIFLFFQQLFACHTNLLPFANQISIHIYIFHTSLLPAVM
jgi:hypothetical protein